MLKNFDTLISSQFTVKETGKFLMKTLQIYRSLSERFGIAKATAIQCQKNVIAAVLDLNARDNIISWPGQARIDQISRGFLDMYRFPGVCQ